MPRTVSQILMAGDQEGRKDRGEVPEKNHLRSAEGVELSERKASDNPQVFPFFLNQVFSYCFVPNFLFIGMSSPATYL